MWKWIIGTIIGVIILMIIIKISTRKSNSSYDGLSSSLESIKRRFDSVCKKIGIRSGC